MCRGRRLKPMLGAKTLFVNPPLVDGIGFTRQGRCQEREEVLGTTKPPDSLALGAALLRDRGCDVRLADLTATRESVESLIVRLDRRGVPSYARSLPEHHPDARRRPDGDGWLKARYGGPLFCFGPHASCAPESSMKRAPAVDGMFVGEPEDGLIALARLDSLDGLDAIPSLTYRRGGQIVPHRAHASFTGLLEAPDPRLGSA